jgi:lysylphosphatidylglycerol synthetase-like protein (DUF2156 family)
VANRRASRDEGINFSAMEASSVRPGYELWRPNREKAESKTTKALVALVLLVSAALVAIITLGGWEHLQSSSVAVMSLIYAGLYVVFAVLIMRWQRGLLPVASALAIILTIFAVIAGPAWFDRSKDGLDPPVLPDDLLGLLTLILIPVQILLIVVAMVAFNQNWHVEEERPVGGVPLAGEDEDEYDDTPTSEPTTSGESAEYEDDLPPGSDEPPPDER